MRNSQKNGLLRMLKIIYSLENLQIVKHVFRGDFNHFIFLFYRTEKNAHSVWGAL